MASSSLSLRADQGNIFLPINNPIQENLYGREPFFLKSDYLDVTKLELSQNQALPATYTWNTEHKIIRIAKQILSIIIFPIAIYQFLHFLAAKLAFLPASSPNLIGYPKNFANEYRSNINLNDVWKFKRITVEVDGYHVDGVIVGRAPTLGNGRWVLSSNGNGEFYEGKLSWGHDFKRILSELNGNAIVFNYPGVGASSGLPSRSAMAKAYRAMLTFLEDRENGIGANEIIGWGHSIGAVVQGEALDNHELKTDIRYVFVKSRTFSTMSELVTSMICKQIGYLVKAIGWNMGTVESSKKLKAPEIILQTAEVEEYVELKDSSSIINDGIIRTDGSLAKALLDDPDCPKNKVIIGIPEGHNTPLSNPSYITGKVNALLHREI